MPGADLIDTNLQKAYFGGYTQGVGVNNLFVFNFFGELVFAEYTSWELERLQSCCCFGTLLYTLLE